jgi:transposase-like protein
MMQPISFKRHRFPPSVILHAVWLYTRFKLSFHVVEEMLAGWCQTNDKGSLIDASARPVKQPVAATQPGRRSGFVCRYRG